MEWWDETAQRWLNRKQYAHLRRSESVRRRAARRIVRNIAKLARFKKLKQLTK